MKKAFLFALLLVFQSVFLPAQTPSICPVLNEPGADECLDACLHCQLNLYNGQTSGYTPGMAPGFCSTALNDQWLGFTAGADNISISVMPSNCQQGDGLEIALYADCSAPPIACSAGQAGDGDQPRELFAALTPGQSYFLMITGYNGDVCDFEISISPDDAVAVPAIGATGPIQGPTVVAPQSPLTYSVDSVAMATSYLWSGPTGCLINGQSPPVEIPAPGGSQVTVTFGDTGGILSAQARRSCSESNVSTQQIYIGKAPLAPPCPTSNMPGADICDDACVLCDFSNYSGSTFGYTPDSAANFCGIIDNNQWIGFVASAPAATFKFTNTNCVKGHGLQVALYKDCSEPPLACFTGKQNGAADTISITAQLQPGQNYFLMVDGYLEDKCNFNISVDPPMAAQALPLQINGPITGLGTVCPGAIVTYSIPPVDGAAGYTWDAPAGWLINGKPAPTTIIGAGGHTVTAVASPAGGQIVVFAANSCSVSTPVFKNILNQPIPPTVLPPVVICYEDGPYELPWGGYANNSGLYFTTFQSYLGCDSIVRQQVTIKPPIVTTLPPIAICAGESIEICGNTYSYGGSYAHICESSQGCDSLINFTLLILEPLADIFPAQNPLCTTLPTTLNSAPSPGTKAWRNAAGDIIGTGNTVTITEPGTYSLTVNASAGGSFCTATDTITISPDAPPEAVATGGIITCALPALQLNGASSTPGVQFAWTGPNGFISNEEDPFVDSPGTYILTVTDPQTTCSATATAPVFEDINPPLLPIIDDVTLNCQVISAELCCTTIEPGSTCSWEPLGFPGPGTPCITVNTPGTYTLIVTGENGCTATKEVEVFADIQVPVITAYADTITCLNPNVEIYCSVDIPGSTCSWEQVGMEYIVTAVAPNGCTATGTVQVPINANIPNASVEDDTLSCDQPEVMLVCVTSTPGVVFNWSGPGNFSSMFQNPTVDLPGPYTVTVTDPSNGCISVAIADVFANSDLPQVNVAPPPIITCAMPVVTLSASTDVQTAEFLWEGPNGFTSDLPNPEVEEPGVYTVTVTNPQTGCFATAVTQVSMDIQPPVVNVPSVMTLTCQDTCIALPCDIGVPGISCCWIGPDLPPCDPNPVACTSGPYGLILTSAQNGCSDTAFLTLVIDNQAPALSVDPADTLTCNNPIITLTCNAGSPLIEFYWTGPNNFNSNSQNPIVTAPGLYTVTATNIATGCTSSATVTAPGDLQSPEIELVQFSNDSTGQGTGSIDVTITHSGTYDLAWSLNGQFFSNLEDLENLQAGVYDLIVTGSNGCTGTLQVTIMTSSAQAPALEAFWEIYPNPTNSVLHLNYLGTGLPEARVILLDAAGKQVFQEGNSSLSTWTISCKQLPPGIYTLLIGTKDGIVRKKVGVTR